jgi:hypothetical protein
MNGGYISHPRPLQFVAAGVAVAEATAMIN